MGSTAVDPIPAIAWLAGAAAIRAVCAWAGEVFAAQGAEAAKAELRGKLLRAVMAQSRGGGASAGDVATVAGHGLDALDPYIGRYLPDLLMAATVPLALAAVVGVLDWVSALVLLVMIALFPLFGFLVGSSSSDLASKRWSQLQLFGRQIADVFEGLPVLKVFGRSAYQRQRIAEAGEALRQATLSTLRVAFLSALVLETLASVSVALVAVPLGLRLLDGSVRLSAALAVLIIAPEVLHPMRRASAEFHESTEGLAAARRAMDMITLGAGVEEQQTRATLGVPPDPARVTVSLNAVSLELAGRDDPVLAGAGLTIAPGETVVLVGANGTGKSTTIALLSGTLAPTAGSVTVGGIDLGELDQDAWRRHIAFLPEHPTLLAATLGDNLRLACASATDENLIEALDKVGAADLLARLPAGLATRLGEGGQAVSAGERQRIALARVLLRGASLALLDEPTVHLDDTAEAKVISALSSHLQGRSALIVTHRPAVLKLADRVVALQDGRFAPVTAWAAPGTRRGSEQDGVFRRRPLPAGADR
jgi:ATP-binding cassette subfamily C protein CydD